jgi:hypothetical protein
MFQHTNHSALRSAQRGLSDEAIEYVLQFSSRYHQGGALICYLRREDLPPADRSWDWANHLVGTALVFDRYGRALITVWRNRRSGLKNIRKKHPYFSEFHPTGSVGS